MSLSPKPASREFADADDPGCSGRSRSFGACDVSFAMTGKSTLERMLFGLFAIEPLPLTVFPRITSGHRLVASIQAIRCAIFQDKNQHSLHCSQTGHWPVEKALKEITGCSTSLFQGKGLCYKDRGPEKRKSVRRRRLSRSYACWNGPIVHVDHVLTKEHVHMCRDTCNRIPVLWWNSKRWPLPYGCSFHETLLAYCSARGVS